MDPTLHSFDAYEASLDIPRESVVPTLPPDEIESITRLTFWPSAPQPADLFFLFGTHQCDWEGVVRMYRMGWFPKVMLPGRVGPTLFSENLPIAHHMRRNLLAAGLPEEAVLFEDQSMNTLEDVLFSLPVLSREGINPRSILFGAKAHHSGRCYLTLRRFFPDIPLFAYTWPGQYGTVKVEAESWHVFEVARARVYGEYRRILTYSARGDIAPFGLDRS